MHPKGYMIFAIDGSSFLKIIDEQNTLRIPKHEGQNLACWCLSLWSLWIAFTCRFTLSWLSIWLWTEVVDPCFIRCHIFMQKLLFVALKQLQTMLWIVNALFLIHCENQLWTLLSHWQMFMQNGEYAAFWYLQLLCYLTQLQFTIGQNKFVEFLVFSGTIWLTWVFSIVCVFTTAFKVSIPPLNHCFRPTRVRITLIKSLLCLNSIFSHQKAMHYQHTKFRLFHCFENLQQ